METTWAIGTASAEILADALVILTITSMCYYVMAVMASLVVSRARRFRGTRPRASILVPLSGSQPSLRANLEAFRAAMGPGDELLVGAARPEDAAIALAREVLGDDERVRIIAGSSWRATNPKIAILVTLERLATREIIVLVDSDVLLDAALLDGLVSPLANPRTGLATALYRGVPSGSLASRLEALWINMDFVPSVLVAHLAFGGIDFALGAANAARREVLAAIGGIATLGEVLADDHVLGKRVSQAGYRVTIASVCVPIWLDSPLRDTLARLLRWCRTYRACRPSGYAATIISHHGVACATVALGMAALGIGRVPTALTLLASVLAIRMTSGLVVHRLVAGRDADLGSLPLLWVRDLMATGLFLAAWSGRGVTWRGRRYQVAADGTLHASAPPGATRRPVSP
jgi:ceramide glucosyltransferase